MTVSRQREFFFFETPTPIQNSTKPQSAQKPQPSSTQDSFAKSKGPALLLLAPLYLFSVSAIRSWAGPPTLLTASAMSRWWMVARLSEASQMDWGGGVHSGKFRLEGCFALNATPFGISGPLGKMLWVQCFCCCCCHVYAVAHDVTVGHTPSEGKERSYFTNIVVHNI